MYSSENGIYLNLFRYFGIIYWQLFFIRKLSVLNFGMSTLDMTEWWAHSAFFMIFNISVYRCAYNMRILVDLQPDM